MEELKLDRKSGTDESTWGLLKMWGFQRVRDMRPMGSTKRGVARLTKCHRRENRGFIVCACSIARGGKPNFGDCGDKQTVLPPQSQLPMSSCRHVLTM